MTHMPALAFTVKHGTDVMEGMSVTSTVERVHGLLRIEGSRLVVQWRTRTTTDIMGARITTEEKVDELREVAVPISALASAVVRHPWPRWVRKPWLEITAADLRAFEALVGARGIGRIHPAQLRLTLERADRWAAEEFVGDLMLAMAQGEALPAGTSRDALPPSAAP